MKQEIEDEKRDDKKHRKSDILWKVVMEEVFDDLLRFIFPDADQVYNLERGFEFLEKELAELYPEPIKETDTRFADKLVRVFTREGQEEWVLCHIEVQGETKSKDRPLFAERMFRYFYRIWDRYQKPVLAVAIFTGPDGKIMPERFEYEYRNTRLLYDYPTRCILDYTDSELEESDNPFAQVLLTAKTSLLERKLSDLELLDRKVLIANTLLDKGFNERKVNAVLIFLENYVLFEKKEMNRIFRERIQSHDKNNIMGINEYVKMVAKEEGLEQGRMEERESNHRVFVENLLKGSDFSVEKIASLANVTVELVNQIKGELNGK
jgi:hypothetical protein